MYHSQEGDRFIITAYAEKGFRLFLLLHDIDCWFVGSLQRHLRQTKDISMMSRVGL